MITPESHGDGPAADLDDLDDVLAEVARYGAEVVASLDARPALGVRTARAPGGSPTAGVGLREALERFRITHDPAMEASGGPRYLGFVTGGTTPAALAGDWIASAFDNNAISAAGGAATIEREVIGWTCEALGLGADLTGAFVTGATTSSLTNLAIARQWAAGRLGLDVAQEGLGAVAGRIRVLSGTPHSSIAKSLAVLGLGRDALRTVPTLPGREAVDVEALRTALEENPEIATIVVANAGTVNTADFDDLVAIAALRDDHDFWLHVDGAFGAFAALVPSHARLTAGIDHADSVTVDLHKWLNVPYDSALQLTRHPDLQRAVFSNAAAYLGEMGEVPDFVHLVPENSRRARAIAAWFTLTAYGWDGHRQVVATGIDNATRFAAGLAAIDGVEPLAPARLNVVCFGTDRDPTVVLDAIDSDGRAFLTPTTYAGRRCIRAAFSNWRTTSADVDLVLEVLAASVGRP